jgi:hypothetical protein
MDERTYFVQLGSLERGPFSRSEIGMLYSSRVIGLDTKLSTRTERDHTTVAKVIFPFAGEFADREIQSSFPARNPAPPPSDDPQKS